MNYYVETFTDEFNTNGEIDLIDITDIADNYVKKSKIINGTLLVFCPGSTGAVITTEFERGLIYDNKQILKHIIPTEMDYQHDLIDNNAHSHLRASLLGADKSFPIKNGNIMIGTWQQIVFVELDVRPRRRRIIFQISGIRN